MQIIVCVWNIGKLQTILKEPHPTVLLILSTKHDLGEPTMSAHEINPITYLLQTDAEPGFKLRSFHCPCKYYNHLATEVDPCQPIKTEQIL